MWDYEEEEDLGHELDNEAEEDTMEPIPRTRAERNRMKPKWMRDFELP